MSELVRKLGGANMDIDLAASASVISWEQDKCPWNEAEQTSEHKYAVKNVSICGYFRGVEYIDTLLCSSFWPIPPDGPAQARYDLSGKPRDIALLALILVGIDTDSVVPSRA